MAKTKEELNVLKNEYETLTTKLNELNEDELKQVCGGSETIWDIAVKLKEKFNISSGHGRNGKPTLQLWDEVSDPKDQQ